MSGYTYDNAIHARFRLDYAEFSLDVDLQLPGRGVTALFGHSGSGKTTLLRCVAGLERSGRGQLSVNGEHWQDCARKLFVPPHQRAIGYVFQDANLFAHLSVRRNLEFGMRRVAASVRRVALEQAVELLGIAHLLERMPDRLSGGERQRIAIARAILKNAPILVLDEATSALDVETEARVKAAVDALRKNRTTFIIAHRLSTVRDADLVLFLDQGRIIEKGTFDELSQRGGRFTSLLRTSGLLTEDEGQQPRPKAIAS